MKKIKDSKMVFEKIILETRISKMVFQRTVLEFFLKTIKLKN